jgi:hypothetical protein
MNTRRSFLAGTLAATSAGAFAAADPSSPAVAGGNRASPGYFPGDVRRYGLLPNNEAAAAENTRALKALCAPGGALHGSMCFPNTTGSDVYYLNDIIAFQDGTHVDLQGSTLHFHKDGEKGDTNSGFIFAVRDFSICNGSIIVDYQMGGGGTNAGNALTFGNRGGDSRYFSPIYDSLLSTPMGNIVVRNLRISSNTKSGNGIFMIGGLSGVVMENVWIDGGGALYGGIAYEFGWATNEPRMDQRQTSHAHNMRFSNINITNLDSEHGWAFGLTGAYNCWIDGLYVKSAKVLFQSSPGEAAFYRPWLHVDQVGAKRNISLRNVVGTDITGTAIVFAGASAKTGGYLHATQNSASDQTDLIDCSIDGFAIDGANLDGGYGIQSSAEKMDLRNGRITNFSRGIVTTHECTRMTIESVDIFGCRNEGMEIGQQVSIWNPPREKMGFVRNCFIAGNSTGRPGVFAAIEIDLCAAFIIEGNRFGYENPHDGILESTQGPAIRIGTQAKHVVCRCNHIGGVHGEGSAYTNRSTDASKGNAIEHASGVATAAGAWTVLRQ